MSLKECALDVIMGVPGNLQGMDLSGVDLSGADLGGVNLQYADLSGANLSGANLEGAHLEGARLEGAHLGMKKVANYDLCVRGQPAGITRGGSQA